MYPSFININGENNNENSWNCIEHQYRIGIKCLILIRCAETCITAGRIVSDQLINIDDSTTK